MALQSGKRQRRKTNRQATPSSLCKFPRSQRPDSGIQKKSASRDPPDQTRSTMQSQVCKKLSSLSFHLSDSSQLCNNLLTNNHILRWFPFPACCLPINVHTARPAPQSLCQRHVKFRCVVKMRLSLIVASWQPACPPSQFVVQISCGPFGP